MNKEKEITKQPIPTKEECLAFYKELTNLASARFVPYYQMAIRALEQEPCEDAISREEVIQSRPEWLSEDVERDTDVQTVVDRAFNRGWNYCLKEFLKNIKELPSVTPKAKMGQWIRTDKDKLKCFECEVIHYIAQYPQSANINYCPNCGAKMEVGE